MDRKRVMITFVAMLLLCGTASAWLSGYDYRIPIYINNTGDALSGYQYNFTIDTSALVSAGKMDENGSDCRITNVTDVFQPFWNETGFNTSSTEIWVNATTLGNVTNTTHYMYYGNSLSTDVADENTTWGCVEYITHPSYVFDACVASGSSQYASVIKFNATTYRMYYQSNCDGDYYHIRYVDSTDPTDFGTTHGDMVIDIGATGEWDDTRATNPCVIEDGDIYRMYYCGTDSAITHRIGYAESSDGAVFTKQNLGLVSYGGDTNNNIILDHGASGQWDDTLIGCAKVVKIDSVYYMYYRGDESTSHPTGKFRTGLATSTDGINFTRYENNPVLSRELFSEGGWNADDYFSEATPFYEDGVLYVFYYGHDGTASRTGVATSVDYTNFTLFDGNPILEDGTDGCQPCCVINVGTDVPKYYLYWIGWAGTTHGSRLAMSASLLPSGANSVFNGFHSLSDWDIDQGDPQISGGVVTMNDSVAWEGMSKHYNTTTPFSYKMRVKYPTVGSYARWGVGQSTSIPSSTAYWGPQLSFDDGNVSYYSGGWNTVVTHDNDFFTVELRNVNDTAHTYDIYVDGVLEQSSAAFRNNINIDDQGGYEYDGHDFVVDWTLLLNISATEPTSSVGAEEGLGSTIVLGANQHGMLRKNVAAAQNFSTIAAGIDHDRCYTWWNSTNDRWETYRVGYSYNAGKSVPEHDSYFVLMDGTGTTISCDLASAETVAIPSGWYATYLREGTNKTLSAIKTDMGGNVVDLYAFNSTAGAWTDTGTYSVQANQGLLVNASTGFNWDGAVP